jgi:gamma-glutamyl hydrolase
MAFSTKLFITLQTLCICRAFILPHEEGNEDQVLNNRPIIGVMMQSAEGMSFRTTKPNYIAASYVKYLESSGARVVPIWNDLSDTEIEKIFNSINGVLFPGGDVDWVTSGYAKVGGKILDLAKKSFDKSPRDYFPVWAICLGHEFLSVYVTGGTEILSKTDSQNITLTLQFQEGYQQSEIFQDMSPELEQYLGTVPITANFHDWSVTVKSFDKSEKMKNFFDVLSTSVDRNGTKFVSTMEGKKYPFFTTQWHPEKNSFEWTPVRNMSHVAEAIETTQYMSNLFVNKARLSQHKFESTKEEEDALIYNYVPLYTGGYTFFEQVYVFDKSPPSSSETSINSVDYRGRWPFKFKFH